MKNRKPTKKNGRKVGPGALPLGGKLVAIIVGVENYHVGAGSLPPVEYAKNDATAMAQVLKQIYGEEACDVRILVDAQATQGLLKFELLQAIQSLSEDDIFVFYYAGHGHHGAGGNRITVWDTHAHSIEGTSLLLREVLMDPLERSSCQRAMAFVDACATDFKDLIPGRDVISDMDERELSDFLDSARYSALFLSCAPGQRSYPSIEMRHGIWTYFLLRALRGEDKSALSKDGILTDVSLRDYLRVQVPRFLTDRTEITGTQTPKALLNATGTFAIPFVLPTATPMSADGDFREVRADISREYFQKSERGRVKALDGYDKQKHVIFKQRTARSAEFVAGLLKQKVDEEMQQIYEAVKVQFGYRQRDVNRTVDEGQGGLDTELFRFWIEAGQRADDPTDWTLVRRLELRGDAVHHTEAFDRVFGKMFDEVILQVREFGTDYETLVEKLEDMAEAHDGVVKDEQHLNRVTYSTPDGTDLRFDFEQRRIVFLCPGRHSVSSLLQNVRRFKLGLTTPSQLLAK